ncbi:transposase [Ancylomarina longa]|uniref:transposase n=1 Tax=Ancylomarina longa TaxID=2487017 RepID=UPI001ADE64CF
MSFVSNYKKYLSGYNQWNQTLNFFGNRITNTSAESFNAKIKAFRSTRRRVRDINFFLFRVAKINASEVKSTVFFN